MEKRSSQPDLERQIDLVAPSSNELAGEKPAKDDRSPAPPQPVDWDDPYNSENPQNVRSASELLQVSAKSCTDIEGL
jgi:hypothetical protein